MKTQTSVAQHTPFKAILWPDHVIGKRESRIIRDNHNALYNSHAQLLAALEALCADSYLADPINADRMKQARAAIQQAKGETS